MSDTLTASVTPGYEFQEGDLLTPDVARLMAVPVVDIEGTFTTPSIANGSITPAKLNPDVAGPGLTGGGGTALALVLDDETLVFATGTVHVAAAGLGPAQFAQGAFQFAPAAQAGTTNVYNASLTPAAAGYVAGMGLRLLMDTVNTGAVSINLNGLGSQSVVKANGGVALAAGDVRPGAVLRLIYDGTRFQLMGLPSIPPQGIQGAARNLQGSPSLNTLQVTADELLLKNAAGAPLLVTNVNVTGAVQGVTGLNNLDTGTPANNSWYYLYVLSNGTSVACVTSLSSTAPNLSAPAFAGYTYFALASCGFLRPAPVYFTGQFQRGKKYLFAPLSPFGGGAFAPGASYVLLSGANLAAFQQIVPPIAVEIGGAALLPSVSNPLNVTLAADVNGTGAVTALAGATSGGNYSLVFRLALNQYNLACKANNGGFGLLLNSFTLP